MGADELIDDEALDPKKLFDESEYSTLIIGRDGYTKKQNATADLIEHLIEDELTREEEEEIFKKLKDSKAQAILISAIKSTEDKKRKAKLVAAVWESGVEINNDLLFFVRLACDDDFELAMEALTVVENIESKIDLKVLEAALLIAQESKSKNKELVEDLITGIKALAERTS
jgi:PleD family two-component response regulator